MKIPFTQMTRAYKVLSLTAIATFLVSLDTSIVVVAQRTIEQDLGHPTLMTWVFSGYNIAYAAGLLTAGRFADVNGRKRSFMRGLILFSIGSVLCGLAPSTPFLVAARIIQAIGGAQLTPASIALVLPEFPAEKRTVAIGIWGAVGGLAAAAGPTFGVALVTLAITQSSEWGWGDDRTMIALALGLVLLALFVQRCRTVSNPLLDLSLFKLPFVVASNISGLFFSIGFLGMWLLNTQWIQAIWEYSPTRSGLATAPGPIMAAVLAAPMGRLAVKWGHARVLLLGSVLLSFGTFMLTITMTPTPNYLGDYLPWMIITGAGVGCSISTLSSSANAFLPPSRFAMGSALNTTARQIGSALGAALAASLAAPAMVNFAMSQKTGTELTEGMLSSFYNAWRFMAAVYLFAGIVMIVLFRKPTDEQMAAANEVEFVD
jgi:MFS family permease